MKRISDLIWLVLLLCMVSCVSYEKYSMEVIKPAEYNLPNGMHKITLVARNLKYHTDTLQKYHAIDARLIKDKQPLNYDSLAIITCLDSLSSNLSDRMRMTDIAYLPVNTEPVRRVKDIRPAQIGWYEQLAKKNGSDGLIVLDMFSCFYRQSNRYENTIAQVYTSNIWSVYDAKMKKVTDRFVQIDTLEWDGLNENERFSKHLIPAKKEAILLAAGVIGKNYVRHIVPNWNLVHREIMSCKKAEYAQAAKLAQKNNWDEAAKIWENGLKSKNKNILTISYYNLALANEMNGEIDQAIELVAKAAESSSGMLMSFENEAVKRYAKVLYRRKIEIAKLNNQDDLPQ